MESALLRNKIRKGKFTSQTSGECKNFLQTNVVILHKKYAYDFLLFCQRNSKPCPIIEVFDTGDPEAKLTAPNSDIRFDVPKYRIYKSGKLFDETINIEIPYKAGDKIAYAQKDVMVLKRHYKDDVIQLKIRGSKNRLNQIISFNN